QKIEQGDIDIGQYLEQVQTSVPMIGNLLERANIDLGNLKNSAGDLAINSGKFLAQYTLSIGQNAFKFVLNFFIMLYLLFFFLREGHSLIDLMVRALPMGDARERLLFAKFAEVTRATVKGNILIAIIQGALGGIIFWILGIPAALLWGFVMAILSLIPAIGASLIWAPVAIYLLAVGDYMQGIVLIAFGAGVIGLIDNILRPILVGRDTKLPDYMVLLSTLGGLALLGINGFVIGPLIAALFVVFWDIFMREINVVDSPSPEDTDSQEQIADDKQPIA
ncbi:MAG TPA: AI-2E family transporter, partial [Cellvibrionaceae bacterium]